MIYLSGASNPAVITAARNYPIGLMVQPGNGYHAIIQEYPCFAADNGCFSQGVSFNRLRWLQWLDTLPRERCLFAVAPDVFDPIAGKGDMQATLYAAMPVVPIVARMGFPIALVAQDGMERIDIPWEAFDALFIGASTQWKLSEHAARIVATAKRRGKHVHMGRVNSLRRLRAAQSMGCDSVDGTFIKFGPDVNLPRLLGWLDHVAAEPSLWGGIV